MKTFAKPYWVYLTVTLPQCLIVLYYLNLYSIVSSQLSPTNLNYWYSLGGGLGLLLLATTLYAVWMQRRQRDIPWQYALLTLLGYLLLLYFYLDGKGRLLPWSIQPWMVSPLEVFILPIGLVMPSLIHALLLLVDRATPAEGRSSMAKTLLGAVAIPTLWYLAVRFLYPLLRGELDWAMRGHLQLVSFMILTAAFMFLLMRLAYQLILKLSHAGIRRVWLILLPFTLILPMASLLIYNGVLAFPGREWFAELQFIGDWSHPLYYLLIVLNGVLLSLPETGRHAARLGAFSLKALFYPIVTYFFVVFLPFFPFAIGGIVFLGAGFLLLSPLLLFFIHTWSLQRDWSVIRQRYGRRVALPALVIPFLMVPLLLVFSYSSDRSTLNTMLGHLYEPNYGAQQVVDVEADSAARVLAQIRAIKQGDDFFSGKRRPYLTSFYQWLVLDNLTLSEHRLQELERVFLGAEMGGERHASRGERAEKAPVITQVKSTTRLSADKSHYISQVDLTITHDEEGWGLAEYATRFRLPRGAWISDYYLDIAGTRVPGILAERRSALWLYQQVRNSRRDPGILYYTSPQELILRVFPFAAGESRQTGFEIIHREPLTIELDEQRIVLQPASPLGKQRNVKDGDGNFRLLLADEKAALPPIQRKPYLHYIVDRSASAAQRLDAFIGRIEALQRKPQLFGVATQGAVVSFANYDSLATPLVAGWKRTAGKVKAAGGFFLERAVKRVLAANYWRRSDSYPLFVVVSDDIDKAVFTAGMEEFAITMPEGDEFLLLQGTEEPTLRHFTTPLEEGVPPGGFMPASRHVLAWPNDSSPAAYLPDDGEASMVILEREVDFSSVELEGRSWENGMRLSGLWQLSKLEPQGSGAKEYALIANSFRTRLLSPLTAFLSPESELQRKLLQRKQQQVLSSMRPLDIGEEHEMDEPPLWLLALFAAALWRWRSRPAAGRGKQDIYGYPR